MIRSIRATGGYAVKVPEEILPEVATKVQVVAATHSPLALNVPGASYVEFKPGYLEQCRKILLMAASEGRTS